MPKQQPGGIGQYFEDGVLVQEVYTSTCSHCANITEFPTKRAMLDHVDICRGCMRLICLRCHGKPCRPFEAEAEREEREARLQQMFGSPRESGVRWRCD